MGTPFFRIRPKGYLLLQLMVYGIIQGLGGSRNSLDVEMVVVKGKF